MGAIRWIGGVVVGGLLALMASCATDLSIGIAERALHSPTAVEREAETLEARPQLPATAVTPTPPLPPQPPVPPTPSVSPASPTPLVPPTTAGATASPPPRALPPDGQMPVSMDFAIAAAPMPSIAEASAGWTLLVAAIASVLGGLVAATIARRYAWQYGALAVWTIWLPPVVNFGLAPRSSGFASAIGVVAVALTCGGFGAWLRRP